MDSTSLLPPLDAQDRHALLASIRASGAYAQPGPGDDGDDEDETPIGDPDEDDWEGEDWDEDDDEPIHAGSACQIVPAKRR